jgi:hypothetical protein
MDHLWFKTGFSNGPNGPLITKIVHLWMIDDDLPIRNGNI